MLFQENYYQKKGGIGKTDPKTGNKIRHRENHNVTEKVQPTRKTFSLHVPNPSQNTKKKILRATGNLLEGNSRRLQHISLITSQTNENQ